MKSLSFVKYYLLHFIYVVIYTSLGIFSGEDFRTISFMFGLSVAFSILIFLYHLLFTLLGFYVFRIMDFPVGPFLFPSLIGFVFNKYFINLISLLTTEADYFYWFILATGFLINLLAYFFVEKNSL